VAPLVGQQIPGLATVQFVAKMHKTRKNRAFFGKHGSRIAQGGTDFEQQRREDTNGFDTNSTNGREFSEGGAPFR
jgi:hypothetical protein